MWYSRNGDEGYTGLLGPGRVAKDSRRIEALGDLDEATSCIGMARAHATRAETGPVLRRVQGEILLILAEVASPDPSRLTPRLGGAEVMALENDISRLSAGITTPTEFILPGDTPAGAALDVARAVVRRAERRLVTLLHHDELANEHLLCYLNRLSSLLYLLARAEEQPE